jgi:hypothetical protein
LSTPEERITVSQKIPAARALEVVKHVIANDVGRRKYKADPRKAFDEKKAGLDEPLLQSANYDDIPENSKRALEALSIDELKVLWNLDRTFVEDGLFVEVPSPGRLMFK